MPDNKTKIESHEHTIDGFTHVIDVIPQGMDPLEAMRQILDDCPHCKRERAATAARHRPMRWRDQKKRGH